MSGYFEKGAWIETGKEPLPNTIEIAESLDDFLQENNKNYKVARSKALKGVEVELFAVDDFYKWSEEKKNLGGQAKIPRVLKEEEFLDFQDYLKGLSKK